MKKILFSMIFALAAQFAIAQGGPFEVTNNTDCYFLVLATKIDSTCDSTICNSKLVCVPPRSLISLPSCTVDTTLAWDRICITPADDAQCNICPGVVTSCISIGVPTNCLGLPNAIYEERACARCSYYSASFYNVNGILIE